MTVLFIAVYGSTCSAGTSLGLYYEGDFVKYKTANPEWDLQNPAQKLLMNMNAHGSGGAEAYLGIEAYTNNTSRHFQLYQGHLKLRRSRWETYFFYRQDRHWVDSPLLNLVNSDRLKDDQWGPRAQGLRYDFWDLGGVAGTIIASKYGTWDGEAYVARLTRSLTNSLRLSSVTTLQDWRNGSGSYNAVASCSGEFTARSFSLIAEAAASTENPDDNSLQEGGSPHAVQLEIRDIRLGSVLPMFSVFSYGRNFRANLSNRFNMAFDKEFDRDGFFVQASWLMPGRAVTLTAKQKTYWSRYRSETGQFLEDRFLSSWFYTEAYLEFLRDITLKCWYEETRNPTDRWKHAFFELGAGNSLGRIKFQYKRKDIGIHTGGYDFLKAYSAGQRDIFGIELTTHITENLQFYQRTGFGRGVTGGSWMSGFYQLAYRGFRNTEIYLEYGNPDQTNDDLVNDGELADNIYLNFEHRVKLFVKMWL